MRRSDEANVESGGRGIDLGFLPDFACVAEIVSLLLCCCLFRLIWGLFVLKDLKKLSLLVCQGRSGRMVIILAGLSMGPLWWALRWESIVHTEIRVGAIGNIFIFLFFYFKLHVLNVINQRMYPPFHGNLAPKKHEESKAIFRGSDFNRSTTPIIYNKAGHVAFSETWPRRI